MNSPPDRDSVQNVLELTPVALAILEGPHHVFTFANVTFQSLFSLPKSFLGKTTRELFPGADRQGFLALMDQVYQTGKSYVSHATAFEQLREDGTRKLFYLDLVYEPFRSADGEITGLVASANDVTEAVTARQELERSQAQLNLVLENAKFGTWSIDLKTNVVSTSRKTEEIFGYNGARPIFEATQQSMHPEDLDEVNRRWQHAAKSGEPYSHEYRIVKPSGEVRWILSKGLTTFNAAGEPILFSGILEDVTEQRIAAQQLEAARIAAENASQAKSAFLANMSHEIRTPLGAIMGFAELLKEANPDEVEREKYLDIILRNGHSLTRVIDDVLDLSKVEAGRLQIETVAVSVTETIEDVIVLLSDKARQKGIEVLSFAAGALPPRVMTDPIRLRQILINIIGNAVKFTDKGVIMVATEATQTSDGGWLFEISVKDSGRGLTREQADTLFQPFVQADVSTTRRYGGTGLGLVLSRRLAQALGGDVRISDCALGGGCTFVISILAEEGSAEPPKPNFTSNSLSDLRLLVIEDLADNQKLIDRILMMAGANVEIATDAHEGLRLALEKDFHVILLDIQMPEMDGYQILSELKKHRYAKPVIAVTAHALDEERERTRSAGFSGHITKPIDRRELLTLIARLTSRNAK